MLQVIICSFEGMYVLYLYIHGHILLKIWELYFVQYM